MLALAVVAGRSLVDCIDVVRDTAQSKHTESPADCSLEERQPPPAAAHTAVVRGTVAVRTALDGPLHSALAVRTGCKDRGGVDLEGFAYTGRFPAVGKTSSEAGRR